jgi:hypothetical protein
MESEHIAFDGNVISEPLAESFRGTKARKEHFGGAIKSIFQFVLHPYGKMVV